jgi:hypothetical protein
MAHSNRLRSAGGRIAPLAAGIGLALLAMAGWAATSAAQTRDLFEPIGRVLQSPRCVNCHPAGNRPLNGDEGRFHRMKVTRGADGLGAPGARCFACHHDENSKTSIVPGALHWSLAPASMGWQGLSKAELCRALADPARNGKRSLADLVEHVSTDKLVLWGWDPGAGRHPVAIPHDEFVGLVKAWAAAGGPCPG